MNKLKIVEVNPGENGFLGKFGRYLSQKLNFDVEFSKVAEFSPELFKEARALLIEMSLSEQVLAQSSVLSTQVRNTGVLDSYFLEKEGGWMPRLIYFDMLRDVLVEKARDLDIRCPSFVVGDGERARVVASVLASLGYSEIYMVSEEEECLLKAVREVSRSYFGIKIKPLLASELTMQALRASILVNTVDMTDNKALLNDLSYFNFMKQGGWVLDLNIQSAMNYTLLAEAERADLNIISTSDVAAVYALLFLKQFDLPLPSREEIRAFWEEFLKTLPGASTASG